MSFIFSLLLFYKNTVRRQLLSVICLNLLWFVSKLIKCVIIYVDWCGNETVAYRSTVSLVTDFKQYVNKIRKCIFVYSITSVFTYPLHYLISLMYFLLLLDFFLQLLVKIFVANSTLFVLTQTYNYKFVKIVPQYWHPH